jgi:8-oxo-dGTP pyrophosphatase MutT (NUDIX family)
MVRLYVLTLLYINGTQHLLLGGRHTTGFGDGLYSLVGGKVESQERALAAIAREVYEEIGLIIEEQEFELIHTLHRQGTENELIRKFLSIRNLINIMIYGFLI